MKHAIIGLFALLALAACKDDSIRLSQTTADTCASQVLGLETTFTSLEQFDGGIRICL